MGRHAQEYAPRLPRRRAHHDHEHDHDHDHDHEHPHDHDHQPEQPHRPQLGAVLDIGGEIGALLVASGPAMDGKEIELYDEGGTYLMHTEVHGRQVGGERQYAGLFPAVRQGTYLLAVGAGARTRVVVTGGTVASVDAR